MTYDEAIRFWYDRVNFEVRSAKPEDLKLERMREFLARLGDPQQSIKTIHVTGTKGKGSTSAMIAAIVRAAGQRVGLFTSPHLIHVEERIQVDGVSIPKDALAVLMNELKPVVDAMEGGPFAPITFFEIATALAWLHFRRSNVDLAVMEVGLGGRFDSTNVCDPAVTVITNIGHDHMAQLGGTLEEIAYQKAGTLKPGVPCVVGPLKDGPRRVIEQVAQEVGASLIDVTMPYPGRVNLLGEHQAMNAAIAAEVATRLALPAPAIAQGLTTVVWPARIEVLSHDPVVILDCAHNVPSARALVDTLRMEFPDAKRKTCVFAISGDKQYREMLAILTGYFDRFIFTQYDNTRCVPAATLAALAPNATIQLPSTGAWDVSIADSRPGDLICVTGSVFLAGELREWMLRDTLRSANRDDKICSMPDGTRP